MQICNNYGEREEDRKVCHASAKNLLPRNKYWPNWHPHEILEVASKDFSNVENEKETIWGRLNGECQSALIRRCEVPHVCQRTFLDPTPRSQYMLTHQLLFRQMIAMSDCLPDKDRFLDEEVNTQLCAKMYKEAQVLFRFMKDAKLSMFGDLFSEHIGLCGFMGYPNFFRVDWLDSLLDMQSKSEYGCFLEQNFGKFVSSSKMITRKLTTTEMKQGQTTSGEKCSSHFTTVALSALAMYADYIRDTCK